MNTVTQWMSWENGINLVAVSSPELQIPNVIVHLGHIVHTPVGSAPSGIICWQPDTRSQPEVFGFVGTDLSIGNYFGPNIFTGTPFETTPVLKATMDIYIGTEMTYAKCVVGSFTFEVEMGDFSKPYIINRNPSPMHPFYQQGVEIHARKASLKVNGKNIKIIIPSKGISGGPATVVSPNGVYAR